MDIILISGAILFLILGVLGALIPALPGPPLSYIGLLLLHFTQRFQFEPKVLWLWGAIALIVTVLDNVVPVIGAKTFGGGKKAVWGSTIGLLLGVLFFPPLGILIGPFLGAVVGELIEGKKGRAAVKAGLGAFLGFLFGTLSKLIVAGWIIYLCIEQI